jgi:hypothetical protein
MGTGGFGDALIGNLIFFVGAVDRSVRIGPFSQVLGCSYWDSGTVRQGITTDLQAHLPAASPEACGGMGRSALAANVIAALGVPLVPYNASIRRWSSWRIRAGGRIPAAGPGLRLHDRHRLLLTFRVSRAVRPGRSLGTHELS